MEMKKIVPAAFFQHQLSGSLATVRRPPALEMYESQLRRVFGGRMTTQTFCGDSSGWADVEDPDDTGI
jgi:hypothetical protein